MIHEYLLSRFNNGRLHNSWIIESQNLAKALDEVENFASHYLLANNNGIELAAHPDFKLVTKAPIAKNISIDQLRDAQAFLYKTSGISGNKILIVQEADLMSLSAANSCLKILEDPPLNTYIFFLTSNILLLLPTIRSRCAKYESHELANKVYEDYQDYLLAIYPDSGFDHKLKIIKSCADKDRHTWKNFAFWMLDFMSKVIQQSVNVKVIMTDGELAASKQLRSSSVTELVIKFEKMDQLIKDTITYDLDIRASCILMLEILAKTNT